MENHSVKDSKQIQKFANRARLDLIKRSETLTASVHWGSSFSIMEIVSTLFLGVMDKDDKFFLSKGHAASAVYAIMHQQATITDEQWDSYQMDGSPISELMEYNPEFGFNISGGSLGLALSYAGGMALLWKKKRNTGHIYVLVGDGELDEGSVWEAIMSIGHYKLDNVTLLIDSNKYQSDGRTAEILNIPNLKLSLESFGWSVDEIDGHNCDELMKTLQKHLISAKPSAIICNTIKGKGISFMEGDPTWHDRLMKKDEYLEALKEVSSYASY